MSLRKELVELANQPEANISELCRRYGISRKTGYKWLKRSQEEGEVGLGDRSRRPHHSPRRSSEGTESMVVKVRTTHPAWGGRKIKAYLENKGQEQVPSASTITAILRRNDLIDEDEAKKHRSFQRFEMDFPNQLWQMDFKGYFLMGGGGYCHPLTILDDHSRFLLGLQACPNQTQKTVQEQLTAVFRHFGLPERMLMDNGRPWGFDAENPHTRFTAWLLRLGIQVSHGRPYHPQTQGKDERLHRTLQAELLGQQPLSDLQECQTRFDQWRDVYNFERPHESLQMQPPIRRYQPSPTPFPETLPPISYDPSDIVRKVDDVGKIYFKGREFRISKAFCHSPVALRPALQEEKYDVFFCSQKVAQINLHEDN